MDGLRENSAAALSDTDPSAAALDHPTLKRLDSTVMLTSEMV
jgi:hypothetical protein